MPILKQGKYQLATGNQWMDRESTGFTKTILKMPPGVALYKMKLGKAKLDIIPYVAGAGNPDAQPGFLTWKRTLWVHRNIGPNRDAVLCPAKMLNKPCPVCEEYNRQMRTNPDDEAYKAIQEFKPKEWDLMQVRDRNDPAKKIQFMCTSYHRFSNEIAEAVSAGGPEQKFGNFWHPKGGQILNVSFGEKAMGRGRPFLLATRVDFTPRPDVPEQVIDKGFKLDSLLIFYKYEKLTEMFGAPAAEAEEAPAEGEEMPEAEEAQYDETTPEAAEGEELPEEGQEAAPEEGLEEVADGEEAPPEEGGEEAPPEEELEEQPAEEEAPPPPPRRPAPKGAKPPARPAPKNAARRAAAPPAEPEEAPTDWNAFDQQGGGEEVAEGEEAPAEEEAPDPEPEEEQAPPPPRRPAAKPAAKPAARPPARPAAKPAGKPAPKPAARPAARPVARR